MRRLPVALACGVAVSLGGTARNELISREVYIMGTRASLTVVESNRRAGLERVDRMLRALEVSEARLSTWRATSEVSQLNAAAGTGSRKVSPQLCAALDRMEAWVRETAGAFDPAVGALAGAWDLHGSGRIPSDQELAAARARSGWGLVSFDPVRCTINLPSHVTLDVGAWGKGDGLDAAAITAGAGPWLIDLGGQVAVQGAPPGTKAWTISIAHPLHRDERVVDLHLQAGSLATSAGSERDLQVNGGRVGHILDPLTGRPADFTGSVSVWHEQGLAADVLSTALFVMGPDRGVAWAESRGIAALYLIPDGDGVIRKATAAFIRRFGPFTAAPRRK